MWLSVCFGLLSLIYTAFSAPQYAIGTLQADSYLALGWAYPLDQCVASAIFLTAAADNRWIVYSCDTINSTTATGTVYNAEGCADGSETGDTLTSDDVNCGGTNDYSQLNFYLSSCSGIQFSSVMAPGVCALQYTDEAFYYQGACDDEDASLTVYTDDTCDTVGATVNMESGACVLYDSIDIGGGVSIPIYTEVSQCVMDDVALIPQSTETVDVCSNWFATWKGQVNIAVSESPFSFEQFCQYFWFAKSRLAMTVNQNTPDAMSVRIHPMCRDYIDLSATQCSGYMNAAGEESDGETDDESDHTFYFWVEAMFETSDAYSAVVTALSAFPMDLAEECDDIDDITVSVPEYELDCCDDTDTTICEDDTGSISEYDGDSAAGCNGPMFGILAALLFSALLFRQ